MTSNTLYLCLFALGSLFGLIVGIRFYDVKSWDNFATFVEYILYFTFSSAILSVLLHFILKNASLLRLVLAALVGGFIGGITGVICVMSVGLLLHYDADWKLHLPLSMLVTSVIAVFWGSCFVTVGICRPSTSTGMNADGSNSRAHAVRRDFAD